MISQTLFPTQIAILKAYWYICLIMLNPRYNPGDQPKFILHWLKISKGPHLVGGLNPSENISQLG